MPRFLPFGRVLLCVGMIHSVGTAAGGTLSLVNSVLPGGGGSSAGSAFVLDGSIGQPVATTTASEGTPGGIAGRAGFWSQVVRWINVAPVAQGDAIDRRSGQSTHVLIRTLLGNDSATDLEVLRFVSFSSASAAGGTIFRDGPWLVYQPPATGGDPADDSFTYTIRDALGTMATGTVRIRISSVPAGGAPNALGVDHLTGPPATVRVHFLGIAGRKYVVETANDAAGPWSNAGELTASADGSMTYSEADAVGSRFFRIRETP